MTSFGCLLAITFISCIILVTGMGINYINIALLASPEAEINIIALRNSIDLINKEILNPSGAGRLLNVFKVVVQSGTVLDQEILYGRNLSKASFILEPHQVDPLSCVLSELLRVPHVTLVDEHHTQCKNVISMRPDPIQLNEALISMIKEDQPRVVAVISEESLGEMATRIMSHDQLVNRFYFQVIATVNFYHPNSIRRAIHELKVSAIKKVLLLIQSRNLDLVMNEARRQIMRKSEYRWYIPMVGFKEKVDINVMDGLTGLQFPTDPDVENITMHRLWAMKGMSFSPMMNPYSKEIDPLFHDALTAIAYSTINYARASREWQQLPNGSAPDYCPVRRPSLEDKTHVDHMKEVMFQGLSGLVKFTKGGYRNITNLEVIEIDRAQKDSLGLWSAQCQDFRWNPETTYAQQRNQVKKCKEDDKSDHVTFKPRKRFLRVVTNPEAPFMFYNKSRLGNDRFSGFCKDLLDRLAKELDFKYEMYVTTRGTYGSKVNGTWDGMVRELIDKRADLALGSLTITSSRETAIDFSKPFMDFTMTLIMKKPTQKDLDVFAFLKPFQGEVWLSIIGVTFIVTFCMFLMDRYSPYGYKNIADSTGEGAGDEFSINNCLWFATASMLQQGPDQTPKSGSGRTLSAAFWFFILIIISTYTANLAAFFTTSVITSKINSLEDLAGQDELEYGILQSGQTHDFFRDAKIPLYRKMYLTMKKKASFQPSTKLAVEMVRKGSFAYLTEDPVVSYANMRKPCTTMLLQNLLEAKSYGLGLQSNSEWTNPISVQILDLRELGFVEQLRMKWWDEKSECVLNSQATTGKPLSLEMRNMAGVYIIMAGGIGIAFILLVVEAKYASLMRGRCFARGEMIPKKEQAKKPIQSDLTYFEYRNNQDMYDTSLKINMNARKSDRETILARPPIHDHFDTPDLYRDAPESTL